jgi:hypothetical protein
MNEVSQITIERDVPIPSNSGRGREALFPFGRMAVGDSFSMDVEATRLRNAAFQYGRSHGKKFTVRKLLNETRCWRIK